MRTTLAGARAGGAHPRHVSGTTGVPSPSSRRDVEVLTRLGGRADACRAAFVHCLRILSDHMIIEASGATVVRRFGVGRHREAPGEAPHGPLPRPALLEKVLREAVSPAWASALGRRGGLDHAAFRSRSSRRPGGQGRETRTSCVVMSISAARAHRTISTITPDTDGVFAELLDPRSGEQLPIREDWP